MGNNALIFIRKDDIKKLFENWDEYMFLVKKAIRRWDSITEELNIDYNVGALKSKDLLYHLAKVNKKIKDREKWVEICRKYDIILTNEYYLHGSPEIKPEEIMKKYHGINLDEYVEIYEFHIGMLDFASKNLDKIFEIVKEENYG